MNESRRQIRHVSILNLTNRLKSYKFILIFYSSDFTYDDKICIISFNGKKKIFQAVQRMNFRRYRLVELQPNQFFLLC